MDANTKTRILIVDDSVSIRKMLSMTLSSAGYEVAEAIDGADGMQKANEFKPQLIITDLNMPNMDGIQLIKTLRANPGFKFIPIIFLTTESQEAKKQEGRAAGATGWIVKPFKGDQLIAVLKKVLG